jgi:hypothetical protein
LQVNDFDITVSAGKAEFYFAEDARTQGDVKINVSAGSALLQFANKLPEGSTDIHVSAGSCRFVVPEGTGLKINHQISAGSLEVAGEEITGDGTYTTDNYDTAANKLEITVDISAGSIEITEE